MPTDLTLVQDRPQTLLNKHADALDECGDRLEALYVRKAAIALDAHESDHGVVFAALDLSALHAVYDAEERWARGDQDAGYALLDLGQAVRDLLGLGD